MRTLSEVFMPGAPTLPEGLRTLVISPERELEPGTSVHASFTFRNNGGAAATGVRVRFNVPDGLVYIAGSGRLDGADLDDELGNSPLLSRAGAHIGDVAPGEERRLEVGYSVAGAIENATAIDFQAAIASLEVPPVGSNVVRLIARSRPQLENPQTAISIETRREPAPGSEAEIAIRIQNRGESSAHDVVVVSPFPEHTEYVAGSARVNGREIERDLGCGYDRVYAPIVASALSAKASALLVYRVRIDSPLPDGTRIVANAQVASQETPAFALEPAVLVVRASPDFGDDSTTFAIEPTTHVRPGDRIVLTFVAQNCGTAAAESARVALELPDSVFYVRGAARIDGRPARERKGKRFVFDLGRIEGGDRVELRCEAIAAAPLPDGITLPIAATLEWRPVTGEGARRFERSVLVRSHPALGRRRNAIVRAGEEIARPGEPIEAVVALENEGTAPALDATVLLRLDPALEDVRLSEHGTEIELHDGAAALGSLEPYVARRLLVRARVRLPYADRSIIAIGASVTTRELGETQLGDASWRVDSHPAFSTESSRLELPAGVVLRPNQVTDVLVNLSNTGTDAARNVRVRLFIPPDARIENVEGAARERSTIVFGEIAPGTSAQARVGLRLLRGVPKERPLTIDAVLTADSMLPVPLAGLAVVTAAAPDFSAGSFRSNTRDGADPGETIEWELRLKNGGDGPARRVQVRIAQPPSLIYVPNSTTVNDVPVRDAGALGPFASERGIVLNEFDPGVEAIVRWHDVVHNQLPAGESILRIARVAYDLGRFDEIASDEVRVRATPVFATVIPGLQFALEGLVGKMAEAEAAHGAFAQAEGTYTNGHATDAVAFAGTVVGFTNERLTRTLRFLAEARFPALVTHLFAVRAFLPDAIGCEIASIAPVADVLHEDLDRLFIKLRLPNYAIAPRDVETPSSRVTIERLLHDAGAASGIPGDPPEAHVVLRGTFDPAAMREFFERLQRASSAGALSWAALARLLPDSLPQAKHYRTLLTQTFDAFVETGSAGFVDALQQRNDTILDAALDVMLASLRAAVS